MRKKKLGSMGNAEKDFFFHEIMRKIRAKMRK